MSYYAHTRENGEWQTVKEHLLGTADKARSFAIPQLKESAFLLGLLHDMGKYSDQFQQKLSGKSIHVDHSTYGAKEVFEAFGKTFYGILFAYAVAGHHSGLPDYGNEGINADQTTLRARMKKCVPDASAWKSDGITLNHSAAKKELREFFKSGMGRDEYEFAIRYLFSCLGDADSLDAESFCTGRNRISYNVDWDKYRRIVDRKLAAFNAVTQLQKARYTLQKQATGNIDDDSGIYLLDMPTGSGKTLCSLSLALRRAAKTGKKRIIYVIPYTTIIEQTADLFEDIMPDLPILEHHSGFDFDEEIAKKINAWDEMKAEDDDCSTADIMKQRTENWDAPFIITTNVQFFESIYSNKKGKLRKLHNMADSIIVFDEIHTLPVKYFAPCMRAIAQLTARYNSEAIFLTATMPDFEGLAQKFLGKNIRMYDLVKDKSDYRFFEKCELEYIDKADILSLLTPDKSALVVCNYKKDVEKLYSECPAREKYCLSTYITPNDRKEIIAKIRNSLELGRKPVVFSTSLIEAGVDLDFDCAFREIAGVDNILQTAGRCNRNGTEKKEESKVYIYRYQSPKSSLLGHRQEITAGIIADCGADKLTDRDCIKKYFDDLYEIANRPTNKKSHMNGCISGKADEESQRTTEDYRINFAKIAEEFRLIDSAAVAVVVPDDEIADVLKRESVYYDDRRKMQRHSASVSFGELKNLLICGAVTQREDGLFVLADKSLYSSETGLKCEPESGRGYLY